MRWILGFMVGCAAPLEDVEVPVLPELVRPADAWGPTAGPGGPATSFADDDLFEACAYLTGDPTRDVDHHNLVVMHDGYLYMPWAPEWGPQRLDWAACGLSSPPTVDDDPDLSSCDGPFGGGLSVFDVSDPCDPVKVGEMWSPWFRETHAMAFHDVGDRTYAAVDYLDFDGSGGVGFVDVTDPANPSWAGQIDLPEHMYPNSYLFLTLSVFWQGPYVYASTALNGVYIVDASDPTDPQLAGHADLGGGMQVGTFHVWGNRAMASSAGVDRTLLVDISDPLAPELIPGGDFGVTDARGNTSAYYFANMGAEHALFARNAAGGGPVLYDVSDGSNPTFVGAALQPEGDGGYIFQHGDLVFQGESNFGAMYDITDPTAPTELGRFELKGDLDTVTPIGNVAFVAVDEGGRTGESTAIVPWSTEPDADPPRPGMTSPEDGATKQARTTRVGVIFDEMIEPRSAWLGSFHVVDEDGWTVEGAYDVQENIVNFTPDAPLAGGTTFTVTLRAGGLTDLSGNALAEDRVWTFATR